MRASDTIPGEIISLPEKNSANCETLNPTQLKS